jgi:hypothetical protein
MACIDKKGGLDELSEPIHESGHMIHIAAIDTRPAFEDWPDGDPFIEAIADLAVLDTAGPAWRTHRLATSVPADLSPRCRYADVMLDTCWAVVEIRLHVDPAARSKCLDRIEMRLPRTPKSYG